MDISDHVCLSPYDSLLRIDDDCILEKAPPPKPTIYPPPLVASAIWTGMDEALVTSGLVGLLGTIATYSANVERLEETDRKGKRHHAWRSPFTNIMYLDLAW